MASFSSYGPALAGEGDLLKPDITAPGVDLIAAYSQDPDSGAPRFDSLQGTSMSAPHIAGLGALLKQENPKWSPMAIKSAMMTTARQTTDAGKPIQWAGGDATPLNFGSGEVVPPRSYDPGLVYDSSARDWLAYACAIGQLQLVGGSADCAKLPAIDPSDLNYPSIGIGKLAGVQAVTRTVTNVTKSAMQYRAQVEAPAGTAVKVVPDKITVRPGGTATFKVIIARTTAPLNEYTFGSLTWVPNSPKLNAVRSPIAVKPVAFAAPDEVTGTVAGGSTQISVTPGYTGTMNTDVDGLIPSTERRQQRQRRFHGDRDAARPRAGHLRGCGRHLRRPRRGHGPRARVESVGRQREQHDGHAVTGAGHPGHPGHAHRSVAGPGRRQALPRTGQLPRGPDGGRQHARLRQPVR